MKAVSVDLRPGSDEMGFAVPRGVFGHTAQALKDTNGRPPDSSPDAWGRDRHEPTGASTGPRAAKLGPSSPAGKPVLEEQGCRLRDLVSELDEDHGFRSHWQFVRRRKRVRVWGSAGQSAQGIALAVLAR